MKSWGWSHAEPEQIEDIRARGRIPILVGGTHYYTQSLLFKESLLDKQAEDGAQSDAPPEDEKDVNARWPILAASSREMLAKLKEVDPVMAQRWHPNDSRKIRRSLEIWLKTGRKASDVYAEQEAMKSGTLQSADQKNQLNVNSEKDMMNHSEATQEGLLRFSTILFWPHVPRPDLAPRLDARVDKMIESGLLEEATSLHTSSKLATHNGQAVDETRGIYTAVGYKEFKPYLDALSNSDQDKTVLQRLLNDSVELTKGATRRYAKSQIRWIRIKLIHALEQANVLSTRQPISGASSHPASTPEKSTQNATPVDHGASILDALAALDADEGTSSTQDIDFGDWDDDVNDNQEHKKKEALASEREVTRLKSVGWVGEKPGLNKNENQETSTTTANTAHLYILRWCI